MPIQILNSDYTDFWGNTTPFYISNSGDRTTLEIKIRSIIRITSINNPLTLDPTLNIVTSPTVSWTDEGFRVGDWCLVRHLDSTGAVINEWFSQIVYVSFLNADFSFFPFFYDIANLEIMEIYALDYFNSPTPPPVGFVEPRRRDDLDLLINHSVNNVAGNQFSGIDGEVTRFTFANVEALLVGGLINGNAVGKQSGQFAVSSNLVRLANNSDNWNEHILTAVFVNSGVYDSSWFDFSFCLKLYVKLLWASISGEPFDRTEIVIDQDANTGFFNEANNTSVADSVLIQGMDDLDYCIPSDHTVVVDGVITDVGIGACYISTDDSYYRNQISSQIPITMIIPTNNVIIGTYNSPTNSAGAGYSIEIININTLGSVTTIDFRFIPNAQFNTFMSGVDDGDRLFYIWIKSGTINHLVFADQLSCDPPVGGPLPMIDNYGFLDHSQNITDITGERVGFEADTEDDIAYFGSFRLTNFDQYESLNVRIEAYNVITEQDFTLQQTTFSFGAIQMSAQGILLFNESLNVTSGLPSTSEKINALLRLYPSIDTLAEYGVSIYYPFILNWKYWLSQANANVDFWPTQNKNWEQYDNLADWELRIHLTLVKDGLSYVHSNTLIDNPYNNDPDITSNIDLIRDVDSSIVGVIPQGELMRIRSTHTKLSGIWDPSRTWGMITVEPTESDPRWLLSSVVQFDNNTSNPLYPLAGLFINIQYTAPNVAVLECYFDTSRLNVSNGCKITAKIKQKCDDPILTAKITTDNVEKITTDSITKIKA